MKKIIEIIKRNKKKTILFLAGFTILIVAGIVWASTNPQAWNTGYRLNHQNRLAYFRYGNGTGGDDANFCSRAVNATADKDFFVPTKTYAEMNSFDVNSPSNVNVCCEFSRCKNFDPAYVNALAPAFRSMIQCDERAGCCPVYENDSSISGESETGFFDCIRQGPLSTNSCGADGWSSTCTTKGQVECNTGSTCDCECRERTVNGNTERYCADSTASIQRRTCRVRSDKSISSSNYKDVNNNGSFDLWDDWPDSTTPNPPIW